MSLRIYNTKTGEKIPFVPLKEGQVGMYVCGVTTYNYCHIGHARAAVVFDVVYRELTRRGLQVAYIRNFTDVDDKIIKRAQEEGTTALEVSERYVQATLEDMASLGCLPPTQTPKVTEHIPDIIALVARLVERGHAYPASNGDVYFSVSSFQPYGEFSGRNLEDLRAGARVEVNEQKASPVDFALWKAARPGEPQWESPWGPGRPGWHIECSAMCSHYLGDTFDIHGGGSDLIFPHHENEIAQSEAASGKTLAGIWMHNGMITVNSEKMSKSLNNFFTIRDALVRYHREAIRLFLLSTQYRSPVDFSNSSLEEAEAGLERLYQALSAAHKHIARDKTPGGEKVRQLLSSTDSVTRLAQKPWLKQESPWDLDRRRWSTHQNELQRLVETVDTDLEAAMADDFNTAKALGHLFELARGIGRMITLEPRGGVGSAPALLAAITVLQGFSRAVLGLLTELPADFHLDLNRRRLSELQLAEAEVEAEIQARWQARSEKRFADADRIRDSLLARGIQVEDSPEGTLWRVASRASGPSQA